MIKVMHLVISLNVGGLEKFVLDLASNYSKDILPVVVCLDEIGALGKKEKTIEKYVMTDKSSSKIYKIFKVISFAKRNNFDIIHTHNLAAHFYGAVTSLFLGIPLVHTKHGKHYPEKIKKIFLEIFSLRFTKMIVSVSDDIKDSYLKITKCQKERVTTILNGVDISKFTLKNNIINDKSIVNIGIVARLSVEKDHQTLLEALSLALKSNPNLQLSIVGDGPEMGRLHELVQKLAIASNVQFLGSRFDIPDILSNLDMFILSSRTEGTPISLLEAMASGLPCIATNVGGNPEVINDNVTGFIVQPGSPQELADKMLILGSDSSLRRQMGAAGRSRIIQHYSISNTAKSYEELYRSIIYNMQN